MSDPETTLEELARLRAGLEEIAYNPSTWYHQSSKRARAILGDESNDDE